MNETRVVSHTGADSNRHRFETRFTLTYRPCSFRLRGNAPNKQLPRPVVSVHRALNDVSGMTRASSPNGRDVGSALRRRPQLPRSLWQFRNFPRLSAQRQRRMTRLRTSHIPFITRPGFIYYCYFSPEVSETRCTKRANGEEVNRNKTKAAKSNEANGAQMHLHRRCPFF